MTTLPRMTCPRCWSSCVDPANHASPCAFCGGSGRADDSFLSPHFTLSEMLASQTAVRRGIPNDPSLAVIRSLTDLCVNVLEPLRMKCGPIHVDSAYRSPSLNIAVGGATHSAHVDGEAADCIPLQVSKVDLMHEVMLSGVPYDQAIWEFSQWVHVAHRGPGGCQRRESKMIFAGTGYLAYDQNDSRVA